MTGQVDPHATHTPEQIGELQDALAHLSDAIGHLASEIVGDFDDPDIDHVIRHAREARMWLVEVLANAGHEPEPPPDEHVDPERPAPIH